MINARRRWFSDEGKLLARIKEMLEKQKKTDKTQHLFIKKPHFSQNSLSFMKPQEGKTENKFKITSWHVMHYIQTEKLKHAVYPVRVSLQVLKRCLQIKQINEVHLSAIQPDLEAHLHNLAVQSQTDSSVFVPLVQILDNPFKISREFYQSKFLTQIVFSGFIKIITESDDPQANDLARVVSNLLYCTVYKQNIDEDTSIMVDETTESAPTVVDTLKIDELLWFLDRAIDKFALQPYDESKVNLFAEVVKSVLMAATSVQGSLKHCHYYVFDKVTYFLMKFDQSISVANWTDICHQLIRKCVFFVNEDLMIMYRKKVNANLNKLTGAQIPKMAFITSRSQIPFQEMIYRNVLGAGVIRRSNHYEIGSLIPSLARARFRNFDVISDLVSSYVVFASRDVEKHFDQPNFQKIFLERLLQLDYHRLATPEAEQFFVQMKTLLHSKMSQTEDIDKIQILEQCLQYVEVRQCYSLVEEQQVEGGLMTKYEASIELMSDELL